MPDFRLIPLTRRPRTPDNARSLKKISSTPAPSLRSRVFYAPHSGGLRTCAGRWLSMEVSGSRKAPDALICVESTSTLFLGGFSISKKSGGHPHGC